MKYGILGGAVALVALAGIAVAQISPPLSYVTNITPTDAIGIQPGAAPTSSRVFATPPQLAAQIGYYKSAPATGFTYTFGANVISAMFRDSTTLSTGSVTLPASPNDGQPACIYSKNIITTLTLAANTAQTLNDAVTTLGAAGHACFVYSAANATWDRQE